MTNSYNVADKSFKMCCTCKYWDGWRKFDGFSTFTYDMNNLKGRCCHLLWKGFSGSTMEATQCCQDHESQYK